MKKSDYRLDRFGNTEISHNIYTADSDLTEAELDAYTDKIRAALTANGNRCEVDAQDNLISLDGNAGGNINQFLAIVGEMYKRGCFLETDKCVDANGNWEQYEICGEEIAELKLKAFLNQYPAKSLPAYTVEYGEGGDISNGNEVIIQRRRGIGQNCRYLFSGQISDMTDVVAEKCFADYRDAKKCLYRCIDALPVKWAHIFYINDNESLSFVGSYTANRPADKQFWFES